MRGEGLIHHRERERGQRVLGRPGCQQDRISGEQAAAVPQGARVFKRVSV